jgi:sigma-B regulation protein RsbU (phosphoserine phosphatase)
VTEAFDPQHELYGSERLAEAVASLASFSADAVLGGIVDGITAFAAGAPQSDDVTLAILKVHDTKPQDT